MWPGNSKNASDELLKYIDTMSSEMLPSVSGESVEAAWTPGDVAIRTDRIPLDGVGFEVTVEVSVCTCIEVEDVACLGVG